MRPSWRILVATAAALLVAPQLVAADDVQDQLRQMQERMSQLEDQLNATHDQLEAAKQRADAQQEVIEEAGLAGGRSAASALSRFLEQTQFSGWVAASYWYNLNFEKAGRPNNGEIQDVNRGDDDWFANPFHPDHNTFQLDQLWFSMEKPATEESRAGFAVDLVMGKTADNLINGGADSREDGWDDGANGNDVTVYQAYAQYLAPIGAGITIKAGRFATVVGAEVAQTTQNFNITRGLLYSTLQPINHVGMLVSSQYDSGFDWAVGVSNTAWENRNTDDDNSKALIAHLGFAPNDQMAFGANVIYGGNSPLGGVADEDEDKAGLLDFVVNWDPSDSLSAWVNFDYAWSEDDGRAGDPEAYGVAAAARLALSDTCGVAVRGEFIEFDDASLWGGSTNPFFASFDDNLWSVTATADTSLTDNLVLKIEARYEEGDSEYPFSGQDFYVDDDYPGYDEEQWLLGIELTYSF